MPCEATECFPFKYFLGRCCSLFPRSQYTASSRTMKSLRNHGTCPTEKLKEIFTARRLLLQSQKVSFFLYSLCLYSIIHKKRLGFNGFFTDNDTACYDQKGNCLKHILQMPIKGLMLILLDKAIL